MLENEYLDSIRKQFIQYKAMAEKAINQVPDEKINWQYDQETNSIAIIVNIWLEICYPAIRIFFTGDGEKSWRNRDEEFENEIMSREELLERWESGWSCFFNVLDGLTGPDLSKIVLIRKEEYTVMEAINRHLAHYSSHAGQIVLLSKMIVGQSWKTLTIPRNGSKEFNAGKGL